MVALNEIMGDEYIPDEKDAYIVGRNNFEMKKRAKIILSRQMNENLTEEEVEEDSANDLSAVNNIKESDKLQIDEESEIQEEEQEEQEELDEEYVGPVLTSDIKLKTKLRDSLPVTKNTI